MQSNLLWVFFCSYQPTSADISVFEALSAAGQPAAADFPHAFRWYSHVKSFGQQEQSKWAKGQSSATSAGGAAEDDDDEDVDLFGSDDEVYKACRIKFTQYSSMPPNQFFMDWKA